MNVYTLYPVRRAPRYAMSLERTAAEEKPVVSSELGVLIGKFLERVNQVVGPDSKKPVEDIQTELGIARMDYLSDGDLLMKIFAENPLVKKTPLSSILPDPLPPDISLLNIVGSAIDRLLLQVATKWYKKEFGEKQQAEQVHGSVDDYYVYYGDVPVYMFRRRAAKGGADNLPFNSQELMVLTTNYLNQLYNVRQQNPDPSEVELLAEFPPNHKDLPVASVAKAIAADSNLAFVNIAPILEEYKHGDVASAAKAALDAAVLSNAKQLVKSGAWSSRSADEQIRRDQEKLEKQMGDQQGTQPAVPKHFREGPDEEGTKPMIPSKMPGTQAPTSPMPGTQAPTQQMGTDTRPAI